MERPSSTPEPAAKGDGRVFASPLAKKVASESGVDLSSVKGTGPNDRIVRADVEAAAKTAQAPKAAAPKIQV